MGYVGRERRIGIAGAQKDEPSQRRILIGAMGRRAGRGGTAPFLSAGGELDLDRLGLSGPKCESWISFGLLERDRDSIKNHCSAPLRAIPETLVSPVVAALSATGRATERRPFQAGVGRASMLKLPSTKIAPDLY